MEALTQARSPGDRRSWASYSKLGQGRDEAGLCRAGSAETSQEALQEVRAGGNLLVSPGPPDPRGHFAPAGPSLPLLSATWGFKANPSNASHFQDHRVPTLCRGDSGRG